MIALLLFGCADGDFDGFKGDDCDPDDPSIHPGAYDAPGDGIDADCDGFDPAHPFVDTWNVVDIYAEYFSLQAIDEGSANGRITIGEDLVAEVDLEAGIREELIGFSLQAPFVLSGSASPAQSDTSFTVYAEGDLFDEAIYIDWNCEVDGDIAECRGALKALEITFDVRSTFERL